MDKKVDLNAALSLPDATSWVIDIRPMEERDLERVREIDQQSFSLPWPGRAFRYELMENPNALLWVAEVSPGENSLVIDPEEEVQDLADEIKEAGSSSQISRKKGKHSPFVVGMIVVWMILDEAHIATLAVDPQYRGLGIARRLLKTALQAVVERNASQATLEVRVGNQPALALYRRFNFDIVGRRPRYYKDNNEDALIMTLNLKSDSFLRGGS